MGRLCKYPIKPNSSHSQSIRFDCAFRQRLCGQYSSNTLNGRNRLFEKKTSSYRVSRSMERIYLRASSAAQISILLPYRSLVIHFRLIVGRRRYYKIIIDSIWNWLVVAWVMQQLPAICVEWKAIKYVWFNGHLHVQIQYLISISTAIARKIDN